MHRRFGTCLDILKTRFTTTVETIHSSLASFITVFTNTSQHTDTVIGLGYLT